MFSRPRNLPGRPTITKVLVSTCWIQICGLSALAVIRSPYQSLHAPSDERTLEAVQVRVQFSGAKQVESIEARSVAVTPTQPLEDLDPPLPEVVPLFSLTRPDPRPSDATHLLALIDISKQPADGMVQHHSNVDVLIFENASQVSRRKIEYASQPSSNATRETIRVRRKKSIAEVEPSLAVVSIPEAAGTDDFKPPSFSNNRPPAYPLEAYRAGIEGEVVLRIRISRRGAVESVEITKSSGHRMLDNAARDAVRNWRGIPAQRNGRAVGTVEYLPVRFQLRTE